MTKTTVTDPALSGVRLLNIGEVAGLLGVHKRTVWRLCACGTLPPPIRVGPRTLRWRLSDLQAVIEGARR